ncbi:MAG: hypothetical protein ACI81R_001251 [Bradymonadia bacterium]|jgi:hypothetical protein
MFIRILAQRCALVLLVASSAAACATAELGDEPDAARDVGVADVANSDVPLLDDGTDDDTSDTGPLPDVAEDVEDDTEPDTQPDATLDADDDTSTDVILDVSEDTGSDVVTDTTTDADAATDVEPDSTEDTGSDSGHDITDAESDVIEPFCGDGTLDDGEACDDGNDVDDDECSNACEARAAAACAPCTEDDECGFSADLCVTLSDGDFCATSCEDGCADDETCGEIDDAGTTQCIQSVGWCERCPDDDRDTICDDDDICAGGDDRTDGDGDGLPDGCDPCPGDLTNDSDGDTVCDGVDVCAGEDDRIDNNENGTPDGCDPTNELFCDNEVDDDNDGDTDCADSDCAAACLVTACDIATPISGAGTYTGTTVDGSATMSGSCGVDGRAPEVVLAFTAPSAGGWCVDTFASEFDTRLSVRTTCDDASTELVCTDDTGALRQSEAQLELAAGQTVYVIVEGYDGAAGIYALEVVEGACPVPGEICNNGMDDDDDDDVDCLDEDCAADGACVELVCGDDVDNDDDGVTDCLDPDCAAEAVCIESLCEDDVDNDDDGATDCDDPDCAAEAVCIESLCEDDVDNDDDGATDCDDTDCVGSPLCGPREECANFVDDDDDGAIDCLDDDCVDDPACNLVGAGTCEAPFAFVGVGTRLGDTTAATNDAVGSCQSNNSTDHVWLFEPPAAGSYCAETVGTSFDTVLYARTACADAGTETACNDDAVGLQSQIDLTLATADPIYLWMDGYSTNVGSYTLNVRSGTCVEIVGACDDVEALTLGTISGTTVGASADVALFCGFDGDGSARVYDFTPTTTGPFCVDTNGSTFDTRLGVLSACDGVELSCDDDAGFSTQSAIQFDGVAGTATTIVLEGWGSSEGDFTLTLSAGICPEFL